MKGRMRGSWQVRKKSISEELPVKEKKEVFQREETTVHENVVDKDRSEKIWSQFLALSADISKRWEGASAVDEIRSQRGGDKWP